MMQQVNTLFFENNLEISPDDDIFVLSDSSGSVRTPINNEMCGVSGTIHDVLCQIPETYFKSAPAYCVHWSSVPRNDKSMFKDGTYVVLDWQTRSPHKKPCDQLKQQFKVVQSFIDRECLTTPHVAFDRIINLVNPKKRTIILFMTDGMMGWSNIDNNEKSVLGNKLADSIKRVFSKCPNAELIIVTVENRDRNFKNVEGEHDMAGMDVYDTIRKHRLTNYVTEFKSFTLNNPDGVVHMRNTRFRKGFIPYGGREFAPAKLQSFVEYLKEIIAETNDIDTLLQIVQNLVPTMIELTKNVSKKVSEQIVSNYVSLFMVKNEIIDLSMVNFMLMSSIDNQKIGQANIAGDFHSALTNKFKTANSAMIRDTKSAMSIQFSVSDMGTGKFVSFLHPDKNGVMVCFTGDHVMIDQKLVSTYRNTTTEYNNACVKVGSTLLACLPLTSVRNRLSEMSEQCMRQTLRAIVEIMTGVNSRSDDCIYLVMSYMLQVVLSGVDEFIKDAYRYFGVVMLNKIRRSTRTTEIEMFEQGHLFTNPKKMAQFRGYMLLVNKHLNFTYNPMTTWWLLCLALENNKMKTTQFAHCKEDLLKDFPDLAIDDMDNLLTHVKINSMVAHYNIPTTNNLSYVDLITMDDTSGTGGYYIKEHVSNMNPNQTCTPLYVLTLDSYDKLIGGNNTCPHCYRQLNESSYGLVGPRSNYMMDCMNGAPAILNVNEHSVAEQVAEQANDTRVVVKLMGTVGAGKTTMTELFKKYAIEKGLSVVSVGVDQFCKNGMDIRNATRECRKILGNAKAKKTNIVIIDTCGERNGKKPFGVDFSDYRWVEMWPNYKKDNQKGYFYWSLRNVLKRDECSNNSNYWLNPKGAGVNTCIMVHSKKLMAHNITNIPKIDKNKPLSAILSMIDDNARQYETSLRSKEGEANYWFSKVV